MVERLNKIPDNSDPEEPNKRVISTIILRMNPEEFIPRAKEFRHDLAELLGVLPDEINIVDIEKVSNSK